MRSYRFYIVYVLDYYREKAFPYLAAGYIGAKYPIIPASYLAYKAYQNRKALAAAAMAPITSGFFRNGGYQLGNSAKKRKYLEEHPAFAPDRGIYPAARPRPGVAYATDRNFVVGASTSKARFARRRGGRRRFRQWKKKKTASRKRKIVRSKKKLTASMIAKKCYTLGANSRMELGNTLSDPWCVNLGHTIPFQQMTRVFFMSLIKKLLNKVGIAGESPESILNLCSANDQVYIYYRHTVGETSTLSEFHANAPATITLANWTTALVTAFNATQLNNPDIQFEYMMFYAGGAADLTSMRIPLTGSVVHFYFNSVMKLQNVTQNDATNTDASDLVAQRVTGKSYYGYGNTLSNRARTSASNLQQTICGDYNGIMQITSNATAPVAFLKEPVPKSQFVEARSSANVHFQPGELKHSYLRYHASLKINDFVKQIVHGWDPTTVGTEHTAPRKITKCKFRYFMLEKEIETVTLATPTFQVKVNFEVNHDCGCYVEEVRKNYLTRENWIGYSVS